MGAVRDSIGTSTRPRSAGAIAAALREAREYTLAIYAHLGDEQRRFPQLETLNPSRWELGHIGWFQEFWCRRYRSDDPGGARTPSRLAQADAWFDSRTVPHASRWTLPIPDQGGIFDYLAGTLDATLGQLADTRDGDTYFYELALYHEDMHGEALLMTLQSLALPPPPGVAQSRVLNVEQGDIAVPGSTLRIGAERDEEVQRFVFDNEKFAHDVVVPAFAIARGCVTEGDFAAFVSDGGYRQASLWEEPGRAWLESSGRQMPAYWRRAAHGDAEVRRFDRWTALEPERVMQHVNAFEAQAWCRWAGRRLPTEGEWERAALDGVVPTRSGVWEWTSTAFTSYPQFAPDPYAEYSAPWFGDHRVMRGGSWATRPRLAHPRFRNFYRPERHDPFVGLRTCAR